MREFSRRPGHLLLTGLLLLCAGIVWLFVSAEVQGGSAGSTSAVLLLSGLAFATSHALTCRISWIAPAMLMILSAGLAITSRAYLFSGPLNAPLGYSNAAGAYFAISAGAALMLAVRLDHWLPRSAALVCAVAFASVPWLNTARTAAVLVLILPVALIARNWRQVRVIVLASAFAAGTALSIASVLTFRYAGDPANLGVIRQTFDATLSERRLMLWRDALAQLQQNPVLGVGPQRFPEESEAAQFEYYARWPHNEFFHFGAETGIPGLAFLLALFGWGFLWLWRKGGDRATAVSAVTLGIATIHANVDFILHFPAVAMALAAVVAAGHPKPARLV